VTALASLIERCSWRPGSTRSVALIRIGLVVVMWAEWAKIMRPAAGHSTLHHVVGAAFYVTSILMLIGLWTRVTALLAGLVHLAVLVYAVDELGQRASHHAHFLMVEAILVGLTPCGGSYSVDRWLAVRRAERAGVPPPPERGNLWALPLMMLQVSAVYFWGAFHKISRPAMFNGDRMQQILMYHHFGSDVPFPGFELLSFLMAAGSAVLELTLAFGLWFARTRRWLVLPGIGFHLLIYYMLPVTTFTASTALLYLAFLDPDAVHRAIDRLHGYARTD
jgi:hypothetical protein